ncbi:MAG TPA: TonB-dependent receptor, partial [Polyangiaceae bacterium LLY-WYZ-15_(1-7)]|nr:TonB-dependent receptor [Polyangiaceae bacterium LLY-WYZ-15_(1-7)]
EARVRVPAGRPRRLALEEVRLMPGALGDPFRALTALPSVQPIFSGFPLVTIRGAPPAGSAYFYDGVPLPALFHLGLGPAVVHPTMIGDVELHAGVAPARYGRHIGGVIVGEGPGPVGDTVGGEVELRTLDAQAAVRAPVGEGGLQLAGRYGYPGLLLRVFAPDVRLAYWDYQARFEHPIGRRTRVEVVALGSFDRFGDRSAADPAEHSEIGLQFHRLELRVLRRHARGVLAAALGGSFQASTLDTDEDLTLEASVGTLSPRFWGTWRRGPWRVRAGGDFVGLSGRLEDSYADDVSESIRFPDRLRQGVAGLYGEATWREGGVAVELGLRGDLWLRGETVELSVDPRLRAEVEPLPGLTLHVAAGLAHQPAVPPFALPGISQIMVEGRLQRAIQSELGASLERGGVEVALQGFLHRLQDTFFADAFVLTCPDVVPGCDRIADIRSDVWSYGLELFLRRDPRETVSGFLSYTLARATIDPDEALFRYTPSFDFRHGLNAVLQIRHRSGLFLGARGMLRTGRPSPIGYQVDRAEGEVRRLEVRLPAFLRLDASLGYLWEPRWGRMRVVLEWFNLTLAREPLDADCAPDGVYAERCQTDFMPALFAPNLSVHAAF